MNTKPGMRSGLVLFLVLSLLLIIFAASKVFAQSDDLVQLNSVEEGIAWLESRGLPVGELRSINPGVQGEVIQTSQACDFPTVERNPNHNYPLSQNTPEVIVFNASWCTAENRIYMVPGSDWWGFQEKPQRLWGWIVIRYAENDLFDKVYPFDLTNTPDVDLEALFENFSDQFKLGSGQRRVIFEGNLQMEGVLPATKIMETLITPEFGKAEISKVDQDGNPIQGVGFSFSQKIEGEWVPLTYSLTDEAGKIILQNLVEGITYKGVEDLSSLPVGSKPLENAEFEFQVSTGKPEFKITVVNMIPRYLFLPILRKDQCGVNVTYTPHGQTSEKTVFYPYLKLDQRNTVATIFTGYGKSVRFENVCEIYDSRIAPEGENYIPLGKTRVVEFEIPGQLTVGPYTIKFDAGRRYLYEVDENLDSGVTIPVRADP